MSYINKEPKDFIKSLQIIHIALVSGVIVFGLVIAYITKNQLYFSYTEDKLFLYMAIFISFIGNLVSKQIYTKQISQITLKQDLYLKAAKYSTAHIYRVAMLEFPALMCIIFVMQSNNIFYFILVGILIIIMSTIFPTKEKFENDVPLTPKEKSILEKL
ncbi:hypothetical protein [Lutibacter sp. B1]|uniref:hypothetical protein n=1 Tax=Lutibacter sp. B1 TaxID=2725996 RepID=UPI001456C8AF|nr:hypothetical protein [Lutibacter sp. B1]NLP56971.1 hypothetical protein [Lutibacter sp. B1]